VPRPVHALLAAAALLCVPARAPAGEPTCASIRREFGLPPDGSYCLKSGLEEGPHAPPPPRALTAVPPPREFEPGAPPVPLVPALGDARPGGASDPRELKITQVDGLRLGQDAQKLAKDTLYLAGLGVVVMGTMIMMPPSVSKWNTVDRSAFVGAMPSQWYKHVSKGPVIDGDKWQVNYIGHPISGAFYYEVARHDGFGVLGSTLYTALMSAFFWEYGIEAFAEVPSTQDLIVTPLGGALLGEAMYQTEQVIVRGGGTILGSRFLGATAQVLLNPAGSLIDGFDSLVFGTSSSDAPPGQGISARSSVVAYPVRHPDRPDLTDYYIGLHAIITL
jgi:hypothetical protein